MTPQGSSGCKASWASDSSFGLSKQFKLKHKAPSVPRMTKDTNTRTSIICTGLLSTPKTRWSWDFNVFACAYINQVCFCFLTCVFLVLYLFFTFWCIPSGFNLFQLISHIWNGFQASQLIMSGFYQIKMFSIDFEWFPWFSHGFNWFLRISIVFTWKSIFSMIFIRFHTFSMI